MSTHDDDNSGDYRGIGGFHEKLFGGLRSKNELRARGQTPAINRPAPPEPLDHIPADPPIDPWTSWFSEEYRRKALRSVVMGSEREEVEEDWPVWIEKFREDWDKYFRGDPIFEGKGYKVYHNKGVSKLWWNHLPGTNTPLLRLEPRGVWFVYGWDIGVYPINVFDDELSALRFVVDRGVNEKVIFWPFGKSFDEMMSELRKPKDTSDG